jgi:hypothetical protein
MKSLKSYFNRVAVGVAALTGFTALTGCQNEFDIPPVNIPTATKVANITIADLKAEMWDDATNYAVLVGQKADGEDYIIKGRVISSDASGNIYKSLVIQDETGALPMSINMTSMYNTYRVGQEIVVDVTGLYLGKYAGYEQIGGYGEYNGTPQTSFMTQESFESHAELNLLPDPSLTLVQPDGDRPSDGIYCIIADMGSLPSTAEGQRAWQGQLVEFRNVSFDGGGTETYAKESDWSSSTTSRTLKDAKGNSITIRNSGYATFCKDVMPAGSGTVRGILSYYNGTWQLLIRTIADVIFDSKGTADDPYTLAEAIELQGQGAAGWTTGYIVGSVKAGVTSVSSNDDIIWSANADLDNNLVIGETADTKDIAKCVVVALPQGSAFRQYGNLVDNPAVYGKAIKVYGSFDQYMGMNGITGNTGTADEFSIDGVSAGGGSTSTGTAVSSLYCDFEGYSAEINNLVSAGWTIAHTSGDKDWWLREYSSNTYATATAYKGSTGPWNEWLISPAIDIDKAPKKTLEFITQAAYQADNCGLRVYVLDSNAPATATKTLLTAQLPTIPASGYSDWVNSGTIDLSSFSGVIYIGWEYYADSSTTSSTYCIDNVNIGGADTTSGSTGGSTGGDTTTGAGSQDEPYSIAYVQSTSSDESGVWVEGYVVGYIVGTSWASGSTWSNDLTDVADDSTSGYVNSNFILGEAVTTTSTANAIPCNIKSGSARDVLGFRSNPDIYLKHVKVKGDITKYFGQRGLKNIAEYEILD